MSPGTAGACGAHVRVQSMRASAADIVAIAEVAYTRRKGRSKTGPRQLIPDYERAHL